jgi:hypothetical protein
MSRHLRACLRSLEVMMSRLIFRFGYEAPTLVNAESIRTSGHLRRKTEKRAMRIPRYITGTSLWKNSFECGPRGAKSSQRSGNVSIVSVRA